MKEQTKLNDKTRPSNTPRGGTAVRVQQTQPLADLVQLARERPEKLTAVHLTQLQSVLGNRAVNRLINQHPAGPAQTGHHTPSLVIQPKLQVNAVGDKYEQEADAVAKEVVQKLNTPQTDAAPTHAQRQTEGEETIAQRIQRQDVPKEDELQLQRQEIEDEELQLQRQELEEEEPQEMVTLQREAVPEEDKLQLQRQELPQEEEMHRQELEEEDPAQLAMTQRQPQDFTYGGPVDSHIEAQINQSRGGGRPMEDSIRQPMEQAFGADFSNVRIHTDAQAHNLTQAIQARAFTIGNDIYFKQGELNPVSSQGRELLAHELTHTAQQSRENNSFNRSNNLNRLENQVTPMEHSKAYFQKAISYYQFGEYRQAIIHFEKARQIQNIPVEIERDCTFNIAQSNMKLHRFATALIYYEKYISMEGADIKQASSLLMIAKKNAGVELTEENLQTDDPEVVLQKAKAIFLEGLDLYENGDFRKAIIRFERVRQMPRLPEEVYRDCLFNIAQINIHLERYATSRIYIEQYLSMPGSDTQEAENLNNQIIEKHSSISKGNIEPSTDKAPDLPFSPLRPRLSDPEVIQITELGTMLRLTFNIPWKREEAVSYLWPDKTTKPPINFFMPDESDPLKTESGEYQNFLIYPIPFVMRRIRRDVYKRILESIPQYEGGIDIPTFVPEDVQSMIKEKLSRGDENIISGAWPSIEDSKGLYWIQRKGRLTRLEVAKLPNPNFYTDSHRREAANAVNLDVTKFVVEEKMSIFEAKARVERINAQVLRLLIAGYVEAFIMYGRSVPEVNGLFPHQGVDTSGK